jgi:hypothetical protein
MWDSVYINANQIEAESGRAVLVKMPASSPYPGYVFWHPAKLCRQSGGMLELSFSETFAFRIFKKGNGKWNAFETIAEKGLSAEEIKDAFSATSRIGSQIDDSYLKVEKPQAISPSGEADPCLLKDSQGR